MPRRAPGRLGKARQKLKGPGLARPFSHMGANRRRGYAEAITRRMAYVRQTRISGWRNGTERAIQSEGVVRKISISRWGPSILLPLLVAIAGSAAGYAQSDAIPAQPAAQPDAVQTNEPPAVTELPA